MSYYPTPGAPYVPQQPVNPYGGMGTVGLSTPLPNTQMQQAQPQRPQPMNGQQPVQQSVQDGGWLLGRPVSSREEFLAIPSDLYGRPTYCPDLRSGVIYCKRLNPDTCESYVQEFYSPEAWRQMQAQQAQQTAIQTQLASCCCENKQLIGDLKYTIAQQDCATRQAIADNARAIVDNCNANFRSMMDYFTQDKIATLTAENQSLKFAASQDRQNALLTTVMSQQTDTILNRVNPRPIPAYQVANPNVGVNCCGCC